MRASWTNTKGLVMVAGQPWFWICFLLWRVQFVAILAVILEMKGGIAGLMTAIAKVVNFLPVCERLLDGWEQEVASAAVQRFVTCSLM